MRRLKLVELEYLDQQPEIYNIIKEFMEELEPSYNEGYGGEIEEIECRRRAGFIPHSHNKGGFDRQWFTFISYIGGSGMDLCDGFTTKEYEEQCREAEDTYFKYDIPPESKDKLKDIPEDKWNWHDLHELELGDIAEEMDDYVREYINTEPIYYGYRAMYEGREGIWHTLMLYAAANQSQYYGAMHGPSLIEKEIKFRNAKELKEKLSKVKSDLEGVFK